ncbi:unnamed protein product [Orchesella dallaii]|uniref:Uncharacterized protein n=1 Tax=Orchesella dallaii TaxID=48710 RepID=A0ABP1R6F4_9HEXA
MWTFLWIFVVLVFQSCLEILSKNRADNPFGIQGTEFGDSFESAGESSSNPWFSIETPVKVSKSLFDGAIKVAATMGNVSTLLLKESAVKTPSLAANISKSVVEDAVVAAQFVTNSSISVVDNYAGGFNTLFQNSMWIIVGIGALAFLVIAVHIIKCLKFASNQNSGI